ncbi:unnamed protein product [Rotaria sordida]|uniref:Helicase C-terminal domain-containing protein n=1 Tax=Rotaria sordida TaxID=392033 RepID=A0A814ZTM8_9BILA|nr:unnamed protein product [Rotaria sordida]
MAMSKRSLAPCTYGTQCNRGEDCELAHPEPLANMPSILPPSRHSNNQPSDSSMPLSHHSRSPHGTRPDKTISRPPFQKRRPASSIRPIIPTANVIPIASLVSNLETPDFIGRTNTPSNRRYRSNSRTQSRVTIPDVREEHELLIAEQDSLLDQLAESDDTRLVKTTFIEHLKGQLETFNTIISSLHTFNPSTLLEAQNHLNILNREIKRLKTHLPIYARRQDLLDAIMLNRVVILKADTGSGKSTQLVQYLVDAGLADRGQIVCTQPRRLAASTLASRVAEEFGCKLGEELIIMSATLDEELLQDYYRDAHLIKVGGRTFPIEDEYAVEDPEDYVDAAIAKTLQIHESKELGDILVFLTGPEEINRAIDEVSKKIKSENLACILPLHGKLNEDETEEVFAPTDSRRRKIIFATNVAETSITIDGIQHVIDSGMVKEVMWDSKRNMRALKIGYTTQSSVKQRRGRAGRTSVGKCYHLYTLDTYESLDICPRAEILCIQPSLAVLKLKHLGIHDVSKFAWLQSPSSQSLQDAVDNLTWLGALNSKTGKLTDVGQIMAKLGLEPMLSAMILAGKRQNCLSYVLALAGMLSVVQNMWWRAKDEVGKQLSHEKRALFAHDSGIGGDHIALLRIFLEWKALGDFKRTNSTWCRENMINGKAMKMADNFIREVACQIDPNFKFDLVQLNDNLIEKIVRCVCAGYFQHLAISNGYLRAGYQLVSSSTGVCARIHRSSTLTLAEEAPKFILYHDILIINETNFLTAACPIDLEWLEKSWLASLPRSPAQCVLNCFVINNLGPALLLSVAGKKCRNIPSLEESLGVFVDIDYEQSQLTIWGQEDKLQRAKFHLERVLDREREKLRTEVEEFEIIGTTRILLGAGARIHLALVEDEYVKVLLTHLSTNVTEEQIRERCQVYGIDNMFQEKLELS